MKYIYIEIILNRLCEPIGKIMICRILVKTFFKPPTKMGAIIYSSEEVN
jgi:hypothetical protein